MKGVFSERLEGDEPSAAGLSSVLSAKRALEALPALAWFTLFIHLATSSPASPWKLGGAFALVLAGLAVDRCARARRTPSGSRLTFILSGLMSGFAAFLLFCRWGLAEWPMARAERLGSYAALAYYHLVFAATMAAAVLWSGWGAARLAAPESRDAFLWHRGIAWGNWRARPLGLCGLVALLGLAAGAWAYALWHAAAHPLPHALADSWTFWAVCGLVLAKAFLTATAEEVCYRGVLQPVASIRFGPVFGILFQSAVYALFHLHLGPAIVPPSLFLAALFGAGILFGMVAHWTRGIGWSCAVHMALDVVVEWGNLS